MSSSIWVGKTLTPADDHHVVGASGHLLHAAHGRVCRAGQQLGEVLGAVADHRQGLLGQAGEHELALGPVGQHLAGQRVDDLRVEVVLPDVEPVAGLARLAGDPGPDQLGQPEQVHRLELAAGLDRCAHRKRPRLGPEDADPQAGVVGVHALALHLVQHGEEVARGHVDDPGLEVEDELHLALGHAPRDGDDAHVQPLRAGVHPQPAGEQPVPAHVVEDVTRPGPGHPQAARDEVGPHVQVRFGVADDGRLASRSAAGVDPHHVLAGDREHAERVVVAQRVLVRERQPGDVLERPHVLGVYPRLVEALAVVGDGGIHPPRGVLKAFQLSGPQLVERPVQGSVVGFGVHAHHSSTSRDGGQRAFGHAGGPLGCSRAPAGVSGSRNTSTAAPGDDVRRRNR